MPQCDSAVKKCERGRRLWTSATGKQKTGNNGAVPESLRRGRPGRPPMDTERFVEAALRIVDEDGAAALTMRSLADRLNSSTSTLYRHFPNRAKLIAAVIDRVVGELDIDTLPGTWREFCEGFVRGWFDVISRHRNVAVLMMDQIAEGPSSLAAREKWLSVLLANGFSLELAARSATTLGHYVQGFAIQLAGERAGSDLDDAAYDRIAEELDRRTFPALAEAIRARVLPVPLDEEFSFGLELILDSLELLRAQD